MDIEATQNTGTSLEDIQARIEARWSGEEPEQSAEQEATPETPPVEAEEQSAPEVEAEAQSAESSDDESVEEVTAEPEPETSEEASFSTVTELAEALEIDPEELLGTLKATVKVNGQEDQVTLYEAIKGYQREADYTRKTMEVGEEKRVVDEQRKQLEEQSQLWQQQMQDAMATVDAASSEVLSDYQSINWEDLKVNDPTRFVIQEREFQRKYATLQQKKQELLDQQLQATQQQIAEVLPKEQAALRSAVPEWKDDKVFQADREAISEYAVSQGFTKEQVKGIMDHKVVLQLRKAMLYDKVTSKPEKETTKTVIRTVSKNMKPGARKSAITAQQERLKSARRRLRGSGKTDDAAALLMERWS